jgi:hypothetical protein
VKGRAVSARIVVAALLALLVGAGVVPAGSPSTAATYPKEFGVDGWARVANDPHFTFQHDAFVTMHDLRNTWIRVDVGWDDIEEVQGVFDWSLLDKITKGALNQHIKVLAVIQRTPTWSRPVGVGENYAATTTTQLANYKKFVTVFAKRYTKPGAVRIQAVELWNEPNVPGAWLGPMTALRYLNLLKPTFNTLKAVNKATTVLTGGLAPAKDTTKSQNARTWLLNLYKAGGRPYFNAVGMHPYTWPYKPSDNKPNGWGNMTMADGGKPSMRQTMTKYGDSGKKIWNTEFGSPESKVGLTKQAAIAADAVKVWRSYSWSGPFFYMSFMDMKQSPWPGMGLMRDDLTKRPVYSAYKKAIAAP